MGQDYPLTRPSPGVNFPIHPPSSTLVWRGLPEGRIPSEHLFFSFIHHTRKPLVNSSINLVFIFRCSFSRLFIIIIKNLLCNTHVPRYHNHHPLRPRSSHSHMTHDNPSTPHNQSYGYSNEIDAFKCIWYLHLVWERLQTPLLVGLRLLYTETLYKSPI